MLKNAGDVQRVVGGRAPDAAMPSGSPIDDEDYWAALVPELLVTNLARSLAFYDACGFRVRFARPEDGFACIERGKAQIMLEETAEGAWATGPLDPPFGRGINLQIEVETSPPCTANSSRQANASSAPSRPNGTAKVRSSTARPSFSCRTLTATCCASCSIWASAP